MGRGCVGDVLYWQKDQTTANSRLSPSPLTTAAVASPPHHATESLTLMGIFHNLLGADIRASEKLPIAAIAFNCTRVEAPRSVLLSTVLSSCSAPGSDPLPLRFLCFPLRLHRLEQDCRGCIFRLSADLRDWTDFVHLGI